MRWPDIAPQYLANTSHSFGNLCFYSCEKNTLLISV
jgi:hypothetical protein